MALLNLRVSIITVVFLLAGCANGGLWRTSYPEWITSDIIVEFPRSHYMYASACAPSRQLADESARAALAKQFSIHIAQVISATRERRRFGDNEVASSHVRQRTSSVATSELRGVEIGKRFSNGSRFCSLAVLDKQMATDNAKTEIRGIDNALVEALEVARQTQDAIERVRRWKKIKRLAQRSEELHAHIRVLGTQRALPGGSSLSSVEATREYHAAVSRLSVVIEERGSKSTRSLAGMLETRLAHCDIPTRHASESDLRIRLSLHFTPSARDSRNYEWITYTFQARAVNLASDATLAVAFDTEEIAHRTRSLAKIKAIETIKNEILPVFSGDLCDWWKDAITLNQGSSERVRSSMSVDGS